MTKRFQHTAIALTAIAALALAVGAGASTDRGPTLSLRWQAINRTRARIRARGEHPFLVVKRLWGFAKVRYRLLPAGATCRL